MTTWLIDTALFKMLGLPSATRIQRLAEANDAALFLSAASLTEIAAAIGRVPATQPARSAAMRRWFEGIATNFADRILPIDSQIAAHAGSVLQNVQNGLPRHRLHDALLVATARIHGHGLLTRRDGVFGAWTNVPLMKF